MYKSTMVLEAILTLVVIGFVLVALVFTRFSADAVLVAALAVLLVSGILTPSEALAGFANPGVMTIAILYVVAAALKRNRRYSIYRSLPIRAA